ncbi:MAG: flotillin domain-containing protein, partial [Ktedonobacterales bacterium]
QRLALEAEGRAAALKAQAQAEAEALKARSTAEADAARIRGAAEAEAARLRGLAEAEVIRAKGEAEAEAMRTKANAYREYNQAAVLDKVITNLPEVVRAIAEPLSKVDKISIVSTGSSNGNGNLGASRITGDMVNMLAQVPALIQALTGTDVSELMRRVPGLSTVDGTSNTDAANGAENNAPAPTEPAATNSTPAPVGAALNGTPGAAEASAQRGTSGSGPRRQPMR